ncbi:MAG: type II and III secretion system protein [Candidatus Hydrogenedentes bacterium]|nr:type II and III secretion system protein [Candidatus Hydrogenedentota bacterium]
MKTWRYHLFSLLVMAYAPVVTGQEPAPAPAPPPPAAAPPMPDPKTVSTRQIQMQVWISETGEEGLRDLGANLTYTRFVRGVEQSGSLERVTTSVFNPLDRNFTVTLPAPDLSPPPDNLRPDQAGTLADGVQTQSGVGLSMSIINPGYGTIEGLFRGIERKSDLDLVSKPEVLVRDNQEAAIHAGGQVPIRQLAYDPGFRPQLSVTWKDVGVTARIKPKALSDDLIQIIITKMDVSDVVRVDKIRGLDLPVLSTRSQTGLVVVPNGQTIVIGGLSSSIVRNTERRVPIVGKMPLVGIPFRGRKAESSKTNLLIFIRPTLIDLRDLKPEAESALNFWREEKWQNMNRISQEIKILQDEL